MSRRCLLLAALIAAGCDSDRTPTPAPGGAADELTIVVEADRSRIAGEEAALQEQRRSLEAERERLDRELTRLAPGRAEGGSAEVQQLVDQAFKLVRRQQELVDKRDELSRQRDQLLERVIAADGKPLVAGAAAAAPLASGAELERLVRDAAERAREAATREKETAGRERSLAEREGELASREKSLAAREASLAQREASCGAAAPRSAERGPTLTRAEVTRAYKALRSSMEGKGVLAADLLPAEQKALQQAGALQARGDLIKAMDAIDAVQAAVDALSVDAAFVSQKVKRINEMQKRRLDEKAQAQVAELLQSVTRSYSDGRYVEANRGLNNIALLIEKSTGR